MTVPEPPPLAAGPNLARRRVLLLTALVAALVLAIDQITKHTIGTSVAPGQSKTVIPHLLHIEYVRNSGVAFGALSSAGDLVYVVILMALAALVVYMAKRPAKPLVWLPTGMLIGGALGNLIDRISRGDVIDFLKLPHWPTFNVADISITFGVIILVFVLEVFGAQRPTASGPDAVSAASNATPAQSNGGTSAEQ